MRKLFLLLIAAITMTACVKQEDFDNLAAQVDSNAYVINFVNTRAINLEEALAATKAELLDVIASGDAVLAAALEDAVAILEDAIEDEAAARSAADTQLGVSIDALTIALEEEAAARADGDVALADALALAIAAIDEALVLEAAAREAGDNELADAIAEGIQKLSTDIILGDSYVIAQTAASISNVQTQVTDNANAIAKLEGLVGDAFAEIGVVSSTLAAYKVEVDSLIQDAKDYADLNDTSVKDIWFNVGEDNEVTMFISYYNGETKSRVYPFFTKIKRNIADNADNIDDLYDVLDGVDFEEFLTADDLIVINQFILDFGMTAYNGFEVINTLGEYDFSFSLNGKNFGLKDGLWYILPINDGEVLSEGYGSINQALEAAFTPEVTVPAGYTDTGYVVTGQTAGTKTIFVGETLVGSDLVGGKEVSINGNVFTIVNVFENGGNGYFTVSEDFIDADVADGSPVYVKN